MTSKLLLEIGDSLIWSSELTGFLLEELSIYFGYLFAFILKLPLVSQIKFIHPYLRFMCIA